MNINLTLFGQTVAFIVFVWFCMKYIWPPLIGALEARKKTIADGLASAERGQKEQELAQQRVEEQLKEAKVQASEIIGQAQKRAGELVEEAKSSASEEGERIKAAAQSEIDREVNRAKEQLRKQVSALAIAGAEQVLNREIDGNAHNAVLDELAAQI